MKTPMRMLSCNGMSEQSIQDLLSKNLQNVTWNVTWNAELCDSEKVAIFFVLGKSAARYDDTHAPFLCFNRNKI
jgi:hypothetical protein